MHDGRPARAGREFPMGREDARGPHNRREAAEQERRQGEKRTVARSRRERGERAGAQGTEGTRAGDEDKRRTHQSRAKGRRTERCRRRETWTWVRRIETKPGIRSLTRESQHSQGSPHAAIFATRTACPALLGILSATRGTDVARTQ